MHALLMGFHAGIVLAVCLVINPNVQAEGSTSGPAAVGVRCFTTSNYVFQDTGIYMQTGNAMVYFCLKACSDAHVLLTESADNFMMNAYEIETGSGSNTYSCIRQGKQGTVLADATTPDVLSCSESIYIWITWSDTKLEFGKGNVIGEGVLVTYSWAAPTALYYMFIASSPQGDWGIPESLYPGVLVGGSQGNCLSSAPGQTIMPVVDQTTSEGTSILTVILLHSTRGELSVAQKSTVGASELSVQQDISTADNGMLSTYSEPSKRTSADVFTNGASVQSSWITDLVTKTSLASVTSMKTDSATIPVTQNYMTSIPVTKNDMTSVSATKNDMASVSATQNDMTSAPVIQNEMTATPVMQNDTMSIPVVLTDTTSILLTTNDMRSIPVTQDDTTSNPDAWKDFTSIPVYHTDVTSNLVTKTSDPGSSIDLASNLAIYRTYFITNLLNRTDLPTVPVTVNDLTSIVTTVKDLTLVEVITTKDPVTPSSTLTPVTKSQQTTGCRVLQSVVGGVLAKMIDNGFGHVVVAIYTCFVGYQFPSGGTSRSVLCIDGHWSAKIPSCKPISCAAQKTNNSAEEGAVISYSSHLTYGDILLNACEKPRCFEDGWIYESVKCLAMTGVNGFLSRQQSVCQVCRCEPPLWVENATALFSMTSGQLEVTCIPGHRFYNGLISMTFTCYSDGSWMHIKPCNVLYCSKLEPPLHGSLSTDAVVFDTIVIVSCDTGFALSNGNLTMALHCLDSSLWNDTMKPCHAVFCAKPSFPFVNATMFNTIMSDRLPYGTILTFVCYEGQKFENGNRIKYSECVGSGYWNDTDMSCGFNRCDPVPQIRNGKSDGFKAVQGSVVTYTCDIGFAFPDNQPIQATVCDGQTWNLPVNDCLVITCAGVNVSNAKWIGDDLSYNSTVHLQCNLGYHIDGQSNVSIYCGEFGNWSNNIASCEPVDCGPPPEINTAEYRAWSSATYSSMVTFYCPSGFWFSRDVFTKTMICQEDGHWHVMSHAQKEELQECVNVHCLPLYNQLANTTETGVGVSVQVTCSGDQFFQTGQTEVQAICTSIGLWSPAIPDCIGREHLQKVDLPKVEAKGAQYVAAASISVVVSVTVVVVLLDVVTLITTIAHHSKHYPKHKFKRC